MEQPEEQILDWQPVVWPGETTWRGLLLPALSHLDAAQPWTSERVLENRLSAREAQLTFSQGRLRLRPRDVCRVAFLSRYPCQALPRTVSRLDSFRFGSGMCSLLRTPRKKWGRRKVGQPLSPKNRGD